MRHALWTNDELTEAVFRGAELAGCAEGDAKASGILGGMAILSAGSIIESDCGASDCDPCNELRKAWWAISNALTREDRLAVQRIVRETHDTLPEGPWEDVTP